MIEVIDRTLGWICNNLDDMIMFTVGTMFTGVLACWHGSGLKKKFNRLQGQNSELLENNGEILRMMICAEKLLMSRKIWELYT